MSLRIDVICLLLLVSCYLSSTEDSTFVVDGSKLISKTNDRFICFTMDWWPPNKCDYGTCAWGNASLINQDLTNPLLSKAIIAMSPVILRLGGSLADHIVYNVGNPKNCLPFTLDPNDRLGFEGGCFELERWDAINKFCNNGSTGCQLIFGLNLLYGRTKVPGSNSTWCNYTGEWDSSNSKNFLAYTAKAGFDIFGFELGNELSGSEGVTAHLTYETQARNYQTLRRMIDSYWPGARKPLLLGPDNNFEQDWFTGFLKSNPGVDVITHHLYSLGAGVDPHLSEKIMSPSYLDELKTIASGAQQVIQNVAPKVQLWVGEAGGAYNSGHHLVTDAFISGFWYLDQIATFAAFGHQSYCRQSLIGGNYGLLNTTTLHPNPDYYSALLWRRLMGTGVLKAVADKRTPFLRGYAHCTRDTTSAGAVTLVLLNLSPDTSFTVALNVLSIDGLSVYDGTRLEYHLTSPGNDLHIQKILLNGELLEITPSGDIPPLVPVQKTGKDPLVMDALSYAFVVLSQADVSVCKN